VYQTVTCFKEMILCLVSKLEISWRKKELYFYIIRPEMYFVMYMVIYVLNFSSTQVLVIFMILLSNVYLIDFTENLRFWCPTLGQGHLFNPGILCALKGLHWGFLTWWDWKYFFQTNVPFHVGLDHLSLCKISDHSRTPFFKNNYSNCKKMTQNEKRFNALHWNQHKNTIFNLFQSIFLNYLCIYFCLKGPSSFM
jgi:hypothetical protein